jgi:hypothetical protein
LDAPLSASSRSALVLTTIADPALLEGYFDNFSAHGHLDDVRVFVIPDVKTLVSAFERCASLRSRGLQMDCPALEEQDAFLHFLGFPPDEIPRCSDNRRNVGYLMALACGAEILVSIDDDNYCLPEGDYLAAHSVVTQPAASTEIVESATRWFNVCELLTLEPARCVYPRGFPYFARHKPPASATSKGNAAVRINAGLWLGDPDLDAPTWMVAPVAAKSFSGRSVVLGPSTWSPINSQNTALHRDAIPAYYFLRMGAELGPFPIDRFGDIFSGYFTLACALHLGFAARFGTPVAQHRRNSHNYIRDAAQEMAGISLLEELLPWLQETKLDGANFADAYLSLSHGLEETALHRKGFLWTDATRSYFRATAARMRAWLSACKQIG